LGLDTTFQPAAQPGVALGAIAVPVLVADGKTVLMLVAVEATDVEVVVLVAVLVGGTLVEVLVWPGVGVVPDVLRYNFAPGASLTVQPSPVPKT